MKPICIRRRGANSASTFTHTCIHVHSCLSLPSNILKYASIGTPKPRPEHKPSSNGCGANGIALEVDIDTRSCCDAHDMCYDTCQKSKLDCDNEFQTCLRQVCKVKASDSELLEECNNRNQLMVVGATAFGCKAYLDAQKNACMCTHEDL